MPIQKDVFIKNYLKALNNGDAAVFAGAGLSASSGCVNWKQLLKRQKLICVVLRKFQILKK